MKSIYLALILSACQNADDCLSIGSENNHLRICTSIEGTISSLYVNGNETLSVVDLNSDGTPEEIWRGFYDKFGGETKVFYDGNADGIWDIVCIPGKKCERID